MDDLVVAMKELVDFMRENAPREWSVYPTASGYWCVWVPAIEIGKFSGFLRKKSIQCRPEEDAVLGGLGPVLLDGRAKVQELLVEYRQGLGT